MAHYFCGGLLAAWSFGRSRPDPGQRYWACRYAAADVCAALHSDNLALNTLDAPEMPNIDEQASWEEWENSLHAYDRELVAWLTRLNSDAGEKAIVGAMKTLDNCRARAAYECLAGRK